MHTQMRSCKACDDGICLNRRRPGRENRAIAEQRIGIVGSRAFDQLDLVGAFVTSLPQNTVVVSGAAPGVDDEAVRCARTHGLACVIHEADWDQYGRKAGPIRNQLIVAECDHIVAFWNGKSRGTLNTIALAVESGKPVTVFGLDGREIAVNDALSAARDLGVIAGIKRARRLAR